MMHEAENLRKRNAKTTVKHESIMQHLREFDSLHPDSLKSPQTLL